MTTPHNDVKVCAQRASHAVVIGGSLAGCLTAAVLARRFQRVTLVEKSDFFDESGPRRSVPQEHHVHLLLLRGKQIIERIFPGFLAALERDGALVADLGHDVKWFQAGQWKNRYRSGIHAHYCSRRLIDNQLRRHVVQTPGIEVLSRSRVTRVNFTGTTGIRSVNGVWIADDATLDERFVAADFVVDASGRGTRMPEWLREAGFGSVKTSIVKTELGYASRIYRRIPALAAQWQVLLVLPNTPQQRAMGVISPIEAERWMVTTGGWFGHFPGSDPAEFLDALASLPVPDIYNVIRAAEPLSDVATFRMPGSRRTHYDRIAHWPAGLLIVGDALSSMNPLYSQGMTICALEAECIDRHVDAALADASAWRDVQRRLCGIVDDAWHMATTEDLRFPETVGERNWRTRLHHWYGTGLGRVSAHHRRALETQIGVTNLVTPPSRLYSPAIATRVVLETLRPRSLK
ncbi:FAD-dependent oxidoreductase (plasmid) [Mycetohabitans endofungorum]|uniref:NAD(P)/FAD-dependent oxidoreductase n=1 Tax=Mycetohabitans endofungorum TaxID=417203 RepID=UPI0030CF5754